MADNNNNNNNDNVDVVVVESSTQKKVVDPKTVRKLLTRTVSLKKRQKIIDAWLATEWNGEQFLSTVLLKPSFLAACFDTKFQHLLAQTVEKAMKQDPSRLSLFTTFVDGYEHSGFLKFVHVQSTLVQCIASAIISALVVNSNVNEEVITNAYRVLVDSLSKLYAEHPDQYCQHNHDMNRFSKTHAYKCVKRVHAKIHAMFGSKVSLKTLETFCNDSNVNGFIMAGKLYAITSTPDQEENTLSQMISDVILKATQANIVFADDGKTTWIPLFSQIKSPAAVDDICNALDKAYKRAKDKINKLSAQFFTVHINERVIPDMVDMIRTNNYKSIRDEGITILQHGLHSSLSDKFFDAVSQMLREGGLDTEAKVAIFQSFSKVADKQQKHTDLLIASVKVVSENDEVKATIVDVLSAHFFSDSLPLSTPILELFCSYLTSRKAAPTTSSSTDYDILCKRILVCIGAHGRFIANNSDPVVKKLIEFMGTIVNGSEKKLADRVLAIYCVDALLRLSSHVPLAEKEISKQNIYQRALSGKTSYLVTSENFARLSFERDFIVMASVLEQTLFNQKHFKQITLKANESNDLLTTTCKVLATTSSWNARKHLSEVITAQRQQSPQITDLVYHSGFCLGLLKEAEERQTTLTQQAKNYESVETETDDEQPVPPFTTKTLDFAFLAVAPQITENSSSKDIAQLFIHAHHPLLSKDELWRHYVSERRIVDLMDTMFQNNVSEITSHIVQDMTTTTNEYIRDSCVNALSSMPFMKQKETYNELLQPEEKAGSTILSTLANILKINSSKLTTVTDEDFAVFLVKDGSLFHDVELELANNPLFLKNKDDYEPGKYSLTIPEWEDIMKKENDMHQRELQRQQKAKVKSEPRTVQDIRKMLVTNKIQEKENATRTMLLSSHMNVELVLRTCGRIALKQKRHENISRSQPWHLILFLITNLFASPFTDLCSQAKKIYQDVAQYQLSISHVFKNAAANASSPSPLGLASMLAGSTYRLMAGPRDESRIIGVDSDLKFAESLISKLRLSLQGHTVSATTFSCLLPFLQAVLHRQNVLGPKDRRFPPSSLSTAMSVLSIHAGLDTLSTKIREAVARICVEEVLNYIPHLSKQAHNALFSMAPFLSVSAHTEADVEAVIDGLVKSEMENARLACLKTLEEYVRLHSEELGRLLTPESKFVHAIFYAQYDEVESHVDTVEKIWNKLKSMLFAEQPDHQKVLLTLSHQIRTFCLALLDRESEYVKYTAAAALAGAIDLLSTESGGQTPEQEAFVSETIATLFDMYHKNSAKNQDMSWGVSAALIECSAFYKNPAKHMDPVFNFIFEHGLNDPVAADEFVSAGLSIVDHHGKDHKEHLISLFENFLKSSKGKSDYIVGSVVVFLGSVARHLSADDARLSKVVDRLIQTLHIQSNTVQQSVSQALSPLTKIMNSNKSQANQALIDDIIDRLLSGLRKGKTYGDRRGMAWGLAGAVRGLGVAHIYKVLKKLHIVLHGQPKTEKKQREGVMLGYECLARVFGKLFEPYIVEVIPNIVFEGFSDSSKDVRDCANDAATHVMAYLTGHGVRMILPNILDAVAHDNNSNWRQKRGNVQLLGHMAYCAPRQLSNNLPVVVRILTETLSDAHSEVADAARKALERVGSSVANPEITGQVPIIIKALEDPEKFADQVLEALIHTRFTHSIDATSLALLVPILLRGLKERSTQVKKKSAQIVGSMSLLTTEPKDLMPYIPTVIPLLKTSLMDPNPQVRTASAKAIGSLGKSIGEDQMGDLVPWLHETLSRTDSRITTVERAGAAQALCEIIAAQGIIRLKESLPHLLSQISGRPADAAEDEEVKKTEVHKNVREGYLQIFVYLPALMRSKFEQFLPLCLPTILNGLSDSVESVRDTALQSSKVIVELFATSPTSLELLFPALNDGLESEEWRTRHSSIMLMYEFLSRLSKAHTESARAAKQSEEEEDTLGEQREEELHLDVHIDLKVLTQVLGKATMDHILAVLFMLQNDVHLPVKSQAVTLWRAMVVNTPRLLKSIVHTSLMELLISHLRRSEEQRVIAGRTMGELVTKLGESVVSDLIPLLTEQLKSDDPEVRQGVCIGLKELLNSSSERQLQKFTGTLLPAVKLAVCDADEDVQDAAADLFDVLFKVMGQKAVQDIVQQLLKDLSSNNEAQQRVGLSGLRQLIKVRAQQVLPKLVPSLIKKPITLTQARALTSISQSLDESNEEHLQSQLTTILTVYSEAVSEQLKSGSEAFVDTSTINYTEEAMTSSDLLPSLLLALFSAVSTITIDNLFVFVELVSNLLDNNDPNMRRAALLLIQLYFESLIAGEKTNSKIEELLEDEEFLEEHFVTLLQGVLRSFNDPEEMAVKTAWHACSRMMKVIKKDILPNYINAVREVISSQTEDDQGNRIIDELPGFNIVSNGLAPLLDIFLQGLRYGKTVEVREQAALGLGDFIALTSTEALAPFVRAITGPLILVVGDRFPWQVKAAILNSLSLMLEKGGNNLKPFLPPLQSAFIKALQDPTEVVRTYAAQSLGKLVGMNPRIDGLITEILTTLKKNAFLKTGEKVIAQFDQQMAGVCIALLEALKNILSDNVVKTLKPAVITTVSQTLFVLLRVRENTVVPQSASIMEGAYKQASPTLEKIRDCTCQCVAQCLKALSQNDFDSVLSQDILSVGDDNDEDSVQSKLCILSVMFDSDVSNRLSKDQLDEAVSAILDNLTQNINGVKAASNLLLAALFGKKSWESSLKKSIATQVLEEFTNALEANTAPTDAAMRYEIVKAMKGIAKRYKKEGIVNTSALFAWVPPLMQHCVKDRYVPVKLATERALLYILGDEEMLKKYLTSEYVKDSKEAKIMNDYFTRVLKRLSEEDSEEEQE